MKRVLCAIFGHKPFLKWYWHSHRLKRRGVQVRCECKRCGEALTEFSVKPAR